MDKRTTIMLIVFSLLTVIIILFLSIYFSYKNTPAGTHFLPTPTIFSTPRYNTTSPSPGFSPTPTLIEIQNEHSYSDNSPELNEKTQQILDTFPSINQDGDKIIVSNGTYQILYHASYKEFIITIFSNSFSTGRNQAEIDFLKLLDITKDQACQMSVTVISNNQDKKYQLSYCEMKY